MTHTSMLVLAAAALAETAHARQRRKYTNEPYIVHCARVARTVASVTDDEDVVAAAWLHDTVEDTTIRLDDLRCQFGARVATLVEMVTNVAVPGDGNRARRNEINLQHMMNASPQAQTIKYADLIDNTGSLVAHDREFARIYLGEKARVLDGLTQGHAGLRAQASGMLCVGLESLDTDPAERRAPAPG